MRKYSYFIVCIFLVVLLSGCSTKQVNIEKGSLELEELNYNDIKDKLIRFHVIANSDSDEDQNLKLKVRDAVIDYLQPKLELSSSIEESETIIKSEYKKLEHFWCRSREESQHYSVLRKSTMTHDTPST